MASATQRPSGDFVGDEVVRLHNGKRVAVLESGGHEIDQEVQALYAGAGVMRAPGAAALLVSLASRRLQPAAVGL